MDGKRLNENCPCGGRLEYSHYTAKDIPYMYVNICIKCGNLYKMDTTRIEHIRLNIRYGLPVKNRSKFEVSTIPYQDCNGGSNVGPINAIMNFFVMMMHHRKFLLPIDFEEIAWDQIIDKYFSGAHEEEDVADNQEVILPKVFEICKRCRIKLSVTGDVGFVRSIPMFSCFEIVD